MFNFKNSGQKSSTSARSSDYNIYTPQIGIKTPLAFGETGEICDMHIDPREQLKDNLRNLILTNRGERIGLNDFGADLSPILFEYTNDKQKFIEECTKRIGDSINNWIPSCTLDSVSIISLTNQEKAEERITGLSRIKLGIKISAPKSRIGDIYIEVTLYAGG